jgi:hypothetical protein
MMKAIQKAGWKSVSLGHLSDRLKITSRFIWFPNLSLGTRVRKLFVDAYLE